MDKVYCVWDEVRYEGKHLLGLFKDQQDAIRYAKAYIEESYKDWEVDNHADYPCWHDGWDEDIFVMDELVK